MRFVWAKPNTASPAASDRPQSQPRGPSTIRSSGDDTQREVRRLSVPKPAELKRQLDLHLLGQEDAKRTLSVATWIGAHPGDFVRLVGKKWALDAGALRLGWTQWNVPGGLTGLRRPVDLFVPESAAAFALWLPGLLAGGFLLARGDAHARRWLGLTSLLTVVSLLVVAFFFGYARLGLLLLPLWMGVAAAAFVAFGRWLVARLPEDQRGLFRGPRGRTLAATLVLLLVALEVAGTVRGHRFEATGTTLRGSNRLDRDQQIRFRPLP